MKRVFPQMLILSACLMLASCAENSTPSTDAGSSTPPRSTEVASAPRAVQSTAMPVSATASATAGRATGTEAAAPVAPAGAQWTLYCRTIRGPLHVEESIRFKSQLTLTPQLKAWYLVHNDDDSIVCYGYYSNSSDSQAKSDKRRIEAMQDIHGQPVFTGVCLQPIASPDPDAPPEWNLAKLPTRKYWSLQIAAFRDIPDRKKAAVDAVREARKMGIEAYYFHGATISSVCIGAWPIEAVKRQGERNVAKSIDPNTTILVINDVLPSYMKPVKYDQNGKPVLILAPKLEVVDETLAATIRKYPDHAVNDMVQVITAKDGQKIASPSFLVQIPHPELDGQDPFAGVSDPVGPDDPDAVRTSHSENAADVYGAGKLRTIGEH